MLVPALLSSIPRAVGQRPSSTNGEHPDLCLTDVAIHGFDCIVYASIHGHYPKTFYLALLWLVEPYLDSSPLKITK